MSANVIPLPEDESAGAWVRRALVLFTCTSVTFLYAMTVTIANVSLPQMQGALSATQDQIAWVVTSNIVATAVITPLSGWLVSRLGWRRVCNGCVIGFGLASLACFVREPPLTANRTRCVLAMDDGVTSATSALLTHLTVSTGSQEPLVRPTETLSA